MTDPAPSPLELALVALLDIAHAAEAAAVKLQEAAAVTEPTHVDNTAPAVDNTAGAEPAPAPDAPAPAESAPQEPAPADPAALPAPTVDDAVHLLEQAIAILQSL